MDALLCRATELSRLHALLDEALAGRPRLLPCSNEAWTGKTALLRQFTDEAARRGVRVVWPPSFGSPGRRRTGSDVTRWARQRYGAHVRNPITALSPVHRANDLAKDTLKVVELRGLEPLTFSLRRHRVNLVRRKPRVIDVHGAAAEALWLQPGAHMGHTVQARFPWCPCRVEPKVEPSSVGAKLARCSLSFLSRRLSK